MPGPARRCERFFAVFPETQHHTQAQNSRHTAQESNHKVSGKPNAVKLATEEHMRATEIYVSRASAAIAKKTHFPTGSYGMVNAVGGLWICGLIVL